MGYIYSMVRTLDDAEDLYQQTCMVMWRKFDQYVSGTDFLSWACSIARFEVLNFLRTRKNRGRYFSDDYFQHVARLRDYDSAEHLESRQRALSDCLDKLRPQDKELISQCYGGSRTIREVAESLGRPAKSVYGSLRRIRRALFRCISASVAKEGCDG